MTKLKKELSLYGLTMVSIGSCIGAGIFLTPSQIAGHLPSPLFILAVWVLGGIITLTGALTFAELGAMFPQAGGVYVYLKEAFGEVFGFMYGWVYLTVIASGAMAAISIVSASYLAFLLPLDQTGIKVAAIVIILIATLVNVVRVKAGEILVNVLTGLKLIGITGVIVVGIWMGKADLSFISTSFPENFGSPFTAFGLALIGVLYSFAGWQYASFVAGEARDARRTVPRAMILGAVVVSVVYIMTNLAYMLLLPVNQIASSDSLAADALSTVLPYGGIAVAAAIFISTFGTVGVFALSTPRIYFAMSEDGLFFRGLSKVHPRFRTPINAILIQSGWAVVLLLLWGTFENLITYVVFTDWVFFGLTAVAVFVFRKKLKDRERPYRVWGYPVTPLIFISITFAFVLVTLIEKPLHALAGLFLIGVSLPFFLYFKNSQKKRPISPASNRKR